MSVLSIPDSDWWIDLITSIWLKYRHPWFHHFVLIRKQIVFGMIYKVLNNNAKHIYRSHNDPLRVFFCDVRINFNLTNQMASYSFLYCKWYCDVMEFYPVNWIVVRSFRSIMSDLRIWNNLKNLFTRRCELSKKQLL